MGSEVRFDGRAVLVTGAGRGLGRVYAKLLAARGASVVVADNGAAMDGRAPTSGPAESVVAEIVATGAKAVACTADLATEEGSNQAVQAALQAFGRIDALLHAASTAPNRATADQMSSADLDAAMRVNCFAGFWMTRAAWPHMAQRAYGRIVLMPSAAIYGAVGSAPYAAAKSAYIGMTLSLAPEGVKCGILVNAIWPSAYTRMTERMPASDYAEWFAKTMPPDRTGGGVAFMLSEECNIHGEMFSMGGGRIARLRIAETQGILVDGDTIEDARAVMPAVMSDTRVFFSKDLNERSKKVAQLLGYDGGIDSDVYSVRPL